MKQDRIISIVVPVYNIYEYLEKCIKSLIEQTYKNIQIILVDDGSNDGSSEICDKYAKIDARITVIHQNNAGALCARKIGTKMAIGRYVLYVDGDDWIEKDRIEKFAHVGFEQDVDMVYMNGMIREYTNGSELCLPDIKEGLYIENQIKEEIIKKIVDLKNFYIENFRCGFCSFGIKKELIQKQIEMIDNRLVQGEDVASMCACLIAAKSVYVIHESGYHYIQYRKTSITHRDSNLSNIEKELYYLWNNFKFIISKEEKDIYQVFTFLMNTIVALTNYSIFFRQECDYLYPYSNVKKGSDIVVYGAGKLGYRIVEALAKNKDYNIVAWVDQNTNRFTVENYSVENVNVIQDIKYDFIIIAILNYNVAKTIKQTLLDKGIKERKIACMDAKVISDKFLCMNDKNIE